MAKTLMNVVVTQQIHHANVTMATLDTLTAKLVIVMDKDPRATTVTTTASALAKMDLLETNVIHQERKKSKVTLQQNCS